MTLSALFAITLAMLIIWRSSDGFEVASEYLGRNLTDGVRGATINAVGSSIPELFTTLFSLMLLGEVDNFAFGIGTTAGSAIFNGMIIPAVAIIAVLGYGIAQKVNVSKKGDSTRWNWTDHCRAYFDLYGFWELPYLDTRVDFDADLCCLCGLYV